MSIAFDDDLHDISLQGPASAGFLDQHTPIDLPALGYFHQAETTLFGRPALISRTGYSGERGYEIFATAEHVVPLWEEIVGAGESAGIVPLLLHLPRQDQDRGGAALLSLRHDRGQHALGGDHGLVGLAQEGRFSGQGGCVRPRGAGEGPHGRHRGRPRRRRRRRRRAHPRRREGRCRQQPRPGRTGCRSLSRSATWRQPPKARSSPWRARRYSARRRSHASPSTIRTRLAPTAEHRASRNQAARPGHGAAPGGRGGWGTRIRTWTYGVRVRCPTVRLSPSRTWPDNYGTAVSTDRHGVLARTSRHGRGQRGAIRPTWCARRDPTRSKSRRSLRAARPRGRE